MRRSRLVVCVLGLAFLLGTVISLAANPPAESAGNRKPEPEKAEGRAAQRRAAADYVSRALLAETEGKNSRRDALLQDALETALDCAPARWHSGYVRTDNRWVKFDQVPDLTKENQRLALYRSTREKYRQTVEDQMALASWCKKAKLEDQWRAHLGNVLQLNPDHQEARTQLGYRLVDGIWLSPQDVSQANVRAAAAVAALNKWKAKLLAIRSGLQNTNPSHREVARQRLAAIHDAAAVPSLELVFCGETEPMALVGVKKFADMSVADASLALARQALFSPWPAVRKAAVQKLKTRNRETYVPELISAMASPTQSRMDLFQAPDGRLLYRHAFYRPGHDRDELIVLDTMYNNALSSSSTIISPRSLTFDDRTRATMLPNGTVRMDGRQTAYGRKEANMAASNPAAVRVMSLSSLAPANPAAAQSAQAQAQTEAAIKAVATAQAREAAVARQNSQTADLNGAICQLLCDTTGEILPPSPEAWSEWWAVTDEVYVPGYKPLATTYVETQQSQLIAVPSQEVATPIHYSCLAAGTPIWTDLGPVAVEKIKVGDRVLAQHPETGELAYKPVLHTTVRMNAELVKLELLAADSVTCSVGHGFWIAGKGWMKARDIQPNMHFHGAAGSTPLRHSEPAGVGAVYNLIVADFHSYFVGKALIYSHDITARKPSDLLVPGLAQR